jgi:hypothetical protein
MAKTRRRWRGAPGSDAPANHDPAGKANLSTRWTRPIRQREAVIRPVRQRFGRSSTDAAASSAFTLRGTRDSAGRVESLVARIDETGPRPRMLIKKLHLVLDEEQGTAVVLQFFDDGENLRTGAETFAAMDPSDTTGTRVSVDTGELKVERAL